MAPRKNDSVSKKKGEKDSLWSVKKLDSEPLLRFDIQWQVLNVIFSDRTFRYTAPVDSNSPPSPPIYLNFDQLYLEAVLSSMKTTQGLRTKLIENPQFAINFCKMSLLINIGRVNTTLAFYPSMKTALRTYHPVPSLQTDETSRKDMQDAPRIKGILKACFLDWEVTEQPTCLQDIARKLASPELTRGPPSTVVNAIFHLFNEAIWASDKYFPKGLDLLDIFYPSDMPSAPRAHAFLSLMHHILEDKTFINDFSAESPAFVDLTPPINIIRTPAPQKENIDPPEELQYVKEMKEVRQGVVKTVPAYQKRDEELSLKNAAKKAEVQGDEGVVAPPSKRQKLGKGKGRSFATVSRENALAFSTPEILPPGWETEDWSTDFPTKSSLPLTWSKIKRDLEENRDPDYNSDEEEAWSYDLLLRRKLLTIVDPHTGLRGPVTNIKEHEEWLRRKETGYIPPEEEEDETAYAKEELDGGEDEGDD